MVVSIRLSTVFLDLLPEFCFQVPMGGTHHQLDSVQLVGIAGTRIIVNGHDVGLGIHLPKSLHHALSGYMVGQAGKRLQTRYILNATMNQLYHFSG